MSRFRIGDLVSYTYEDRHGNECYDTGDVVGVDPARAGGHRLGGQDACGLDDPFIQEGGEAVSRLSPDAHADIKPTGGFLFVPLSSIEVFNNPNRGTGFESLGTVEDIVNELLELRDTVKDPERELEAALYELADANSKLEQMESW